jgi:hypothetical protein
MVHDETAADANAAVNTCSSRCGDVRTEGQLSARNDFVCDRA